MTTKIKWQWHELEEGRGYASAEVGEGMDFMVHTTPISDDPSEVHFKKLMEKIGLSRSMDDPEDILG